MCTLLLACEQASCSGPPPDGKDHMPQFPFVKQESLTCLCCRYLGRQWLSLGTVGAQLRVPLGHVCRQCCNTSSTTVSGCACTTCVRCGALMDSNATWHALLAPARRKHTGCILPRAGVCGKQSPLMQGAGWGLLVSCAAPLAAVLMQMQRRAP